MFQRLRSYLRRDLWSIDLRTESGWRFAGLASLRVATHTTRRLIGELASVHAAALSWTTMLALVPLLALAMSVAKGFGYDDNLLAWLDRLAADVPADARGAIDSIRELVIQTSFSALGIVGSALLVWSGLTLFVQFEAACNRIWNVSRGRGWYRRVTDFIALLVLVPLLLISALSLHSLLESATVLRDAEWLQTLYRGGLGFVAYVVASLGFAAIFRLVPSTSVRWTAALIGGAFAGVAVLVLHSIYLKAQIGFARLNAIYATFAAIPLLIIYLRLLWTAVLVGVELAYAVQHLHRLEGPDAPERAKPRARLRLALLVMDRAARAFRAGDRGVSLGAVAHQVRGVGRGLDEAVAELESAGLVARLAGGDIVAPARPPESMTAADVLRAVLGDREVDVPLKGDLGEAADQLDTQAEQLLGARPF